MASTGADSANKLSRSVTNDAVSSRDVWPFDRTGFQPFACKALGGCDFVRRHFLRKFAAQADRLTRSRERCNVEPFMCLDAVRYAVATNGSVNAALGKFFSLIR